MMFHIDKQREVVEVSGMREELLKVIEKNSRIDMGELAVLLGVEEAESANDLEALEAEGII